MGGKGSGRKSPKKKVYTNYSLAWQAYIRGAEYRRAVIMLKGMGMNQPYIDNWLSSVFGAGFIASGVEIKFIPDSNS